MNNVLSEKLINACTGCGICSAVCPFNAVSMGVDQNGFYVPQVDKNSCTECGICKEFCYRFEEGHKCDGEYEAVCYSARNKDTEKLRCASSGGVSEELMAECLREGYHVVGAAYNQETEVAEHRIVFREQDLAVFRGSKYFQSQTENAFRTILNDKTPQKYAIFGTPCQIYAFSKLLKKKNDREKYLLVDIFCHGCPTVNLWKKYNCAMKKKHEVEAFNAVTFRSKSRGWHEFCFDFETNKGKITTSKFSDPFYELYFEKNLMNDACYNCIPKSSIAFTDIRIGDFWGYRFQKDTKGVSAVVVASSQGKRLFDSVKEKFEICSVSFEEIIQAQSYGKAYVANQTIRTKLLNLLADIDVPLKKVLKTNRKMQSWKVNLKRVIKGLLKHLPRNVYVNLTRVRHDKNG